MCFLCNTFGKILVRFTWDWTTLEENYLLGLPEIYLKLKLMLIQFIAGRVYPLSVESLVVYPTYLTASLVQSHLWFLLDIMATAENDFEKDLEEAIKQEEASWQAYKKRKILEAKANHEYFNLGFIVARDMLIAHLGEKKEILQLTELNKTMKTIVLRWKRKPGCPTAAPLWQFFKMLCFATCETFHILLILYCCFFSRGTCLDKLQCLRTVAGSSTGWPRVAWFKIIYIYVFIYGITMFPLRWGRHQLTEQRWKPISHWDYDVADKVLKRWRKAIRLHAIDDNGCSLPVAWIVFWLQLFMQTV